MPTEAERYPCVQCGYCCTVRPCPYGRWDEKRQQCAFLTHDNLCARYNEIILDPRSWVAPAFGAGCCSPLFNSRRDEVLRRRKES